MSGIKIEGLVILHDSGYTVFLIPKYSNYIYEACEEVLRDHPELKDKKGEEFVGVLADYLIEDKGFSPVNLIGSYPYGSESNLQVGEVRTFRKVTVRIGGPAGWNG